MLFEVYKGKEVEERKLKVAQINCQQQIAESQVVADETGGQKSDMFATVISTVCALKINK